MGRKLSQDTTAVENILALYTFLLANKGEYSLSMLSQRFNVSKATLLRYLRQLEKSEFGKVLCEKKGREHFYSLQRPKALPKIALSAQGLQQLALCRDFMSHMLPLSMQRSLDATLQQATAYLPEASLETMEAQFRDIGQSFSKGKIDYAPFEPMLKTLMQAIHEKAVCTICYKKRRFEDAYTFDYAPQRLISYNDAIYIRGWKVTDKGAVEPLFERGTDLVLHRFQDVTFTKRSARNLPLIPENAVGAFGYMDHEAFTVKIRFEPRLANYMLERIWSEDQEIEELDGGEIILTLTARNKYEVVPWVLGFGAEAEVLEPQWLREKVGEVAGEMVRVYGG